MGRPRRGPPPRLLGSLPGAGVGEVRGRCGRLGGAGPGPAAAQRPDAARDVAVSAEQLRDALWAVSTELAKASGTGKGAAAAAPGRAGAGRGR